MALPSSPADQPVIISYAAPPTFLASSNWNKVYYTLLSLLPLRNLHWKPTSSTSIKTIQELNVSLLSFDTLHDELTSQIPGTLLEKPLLHLFVLHCEDNEVEMYKNEFKRHLKDWHTNVVSRKNQEWLILQIIRPDQSRAQPGKLFQIKNSVLDKMKTEFNIEKRDRCLQLNWHSGTDSPAAWAEFLNKMKEGIIFAFDSALIQREEEVRRSEINRSMPGWNYCTFFILKESLASSFEGMNLFEDALFQYDQLEELFHYVSKEKNMSWFGTLIHPEPDDDSLPLLSVSCKPYRNLILANSISIFDFRHYLLARQCRLLAKMGKFSEITTKVGFFLGVFGNQLRAAQAVLAPFFIEAWVYSSSLSAVEQCNTWETELKVENKSNTANAGRGELLDIARTQLDIFGIAAGYLPTSAPFSLSLTTASPLASPQNLPFSNETLHVAINNRHAFNELYIALTNRAIDLYAKSGRRKFALKLHGFLAAFEIHRGNLERALNTFISLPAHYSPHAWTSLESYMLYKALETHRELEKSRDTEWLHMVLSFLKAYVEHQNDEILIQEVDKVGYVSKLVESLRKSVDSLESDIIQPDHPIASTLVSNQVRLAETRDGSYLDATIMNHLPCTLPAERLIVTITGRDSEKLRYECPIDQGCLPGNTAHRLFCPTSSPGSFVLETSEIIFSRLIFQTNHRRSSTKQAGRLPSLIHVPRDLLAVDVRISQPSMIVLGKPQSLTFTVSTGRNHLRKMTMKISSPSATFRCQEAVLQKDDGEDTMLESQGNRIQLEAVEENTEITFLVPHSDVSSLNAMRVNLEVEYTTEAEPSLLRTSQFSKLVITTLPISVNVEDYFRGSTVISKFTVSTTSHQHVRIAEARLEPPQGDLDGVKIQHPVRRNRMITVTPLQPANFLFMLNSPNGPVRESLQLGVKYRMLREEVEEVIEQEVDAVLTEYPSTLENRIILTGHLIDALEGDAAWVELYGITGELIVPSTQEIKAEIQDQLVQIKKRLAHRQQPHSAEGRWREIRIPVDVPLMNIVASVTITILSTPFAKPSTVLPSLYAGQPISARLTVHTSFHWGKDANDSKSEYALRFNIEEMVREWLISGPKRGDFIAVDGGTYTVPITLIALHHGEFFLPKASVTALPMAGSATMGSLALPSVETYQVHGAEKVLILPRGGRTTFVVGMGPLASGAET